MNDIAQRLLGMAPNAVFVLLPVFAALLMLAYRSRRMRYGTHFVFSMHMHSFWFLALLAIELLPETVALFAALLVPIGYAVWALHAVYGGRWWTTLLRVTTIAVCYSVALALVMAGLGIASVVTG